MSNMLFALRYDVIFLDNKKNLKCSLQVDGEVLICINEL